MFFGKSKKRKSNYVSSPEYNEYIETDNLQDALDLFERMKKHGFEPAGGMNKLRWIRGDDVFDFDKPFGPAVKAYDIPQTELDKLIALLDKLDEEDSGNEEPESKDNAISRDELYKMIQKWRNGSSEANSKSSKLQEAYLEYLDSILKKEGYDTFATDPDTGEELDDYTPEFEATQAEVMNDLGLGDDDIDLIFNGEGDFNDFETEYDDNGLPVKQSDKSHDNTNLGGIAKSITQNDLGRSL